MEQNRTRLSFTCHWETETRLHWEKAAFPVSSHWKLGLASGLEFWFSPQNSLAPGYANLRCSKNWARTQLQVSDSVWLACDSVEHSNVFSPGLFSSFLWKGEEDKHGFRLQVYRIPVHTMQMDTQYLPLEVGKTST